MKKAQITSDVLRRQVGEVIFERGRRYADEGRVHLRGHDESGAAAQVRGTEVYEVEIEVAERGIAGSCTCPFADEGFFCKHLVATVLCWLAADSPAKPEEPRETFTEESEPAPTGATEDSLRAHLAEQDPEWLVDKLLEAARRDPVFGARLAVDADAPEANDLAETSLRAALVDAIAIDDYVSYSEAGDYFWGIDQVLDEVEDLLDDGFSASAARLALFALDLFAESGRRVDDSDGGLILVLERIQEIHLRASENHRPDPEELASTLVRYAFGTDYEVFYNAPAQYAGVLGDRGLRRLRELVEEKLQALPGNQDQFSGDSFGLHQIREQVAEAIGGVQGLIDVLTEDPTSAHDHQRIANLLHQEGRAEEALDWIERGLQADGPDERLNILAATIHREAGRTDRAGDLLWENFAARPGESTYRALSDGTGEDFIRWREPAIALLQKPSGRTGADWTALVSALLWEGDVERAWQCANDGGCRQDVWLLLARARAQDHPRQALPVLLREADLSIETKQRSAYRHAAHLLVEARALAARAGKTETFTKHVQHLREAHRRRPALQDELTRAGLPGA